MLAKSPEADAVASERIALADVFVQQRTARVDRPLTYRIPEAMPLAVGDVVRVPLGAKEAYAFVIAVRTGPPDERLRPLSSAAGVRAFDDAGLALARWMAARYCCSLGEALATVAFAPALPRVVDRFAILGPLGDVAGVPPRLRRLIEEDFGSGFALEALLRHPEARRAGDRATLLRALGALQRAGTIRRERTFAAPKVGEKKTTGFVTTGKTLAGKRAPALLAFVAENPPARRADLMLAGFSRALIARAVRDGALEERAIAPLRRGASAPAEPELVANAAQSAAIAAIAQRVERREFGEVLLQGVTGSGKTLVYLRAIARALENGARAIVLVPEISLTPQTARRFEKAFGERVAVLHSALSERERYDNWSAAARGEVDVVVGARSAVFAPLSDVRLIVVDEAHETSYKQDSAPRYDAVAVARRRMALCGGTLVLGSATPPLEAYEAALRGAVAHLRLDARATDAPMPHTHVVDLGAEFAAGNRRIFSSLLVEALGARLRAGEKSVFFVNRRGSARFLLCRACGHVPNCARCDVSLVAHAAERLLRCHLCDAQAALPERCPNCKEGPIREFGVGTQTVADAIAKLYPDARVVRMDGDTTTRVGDHARLLEEFEARGDVLVGTQMVAKGLDFPTVTLAAVVAADAGLHAPDFRAAERTFDLIAQVAGRSGRTRPGEAVVQTYSPAHPAIVFAAQHDFDGFAERELAQRRELRYPPYAELIYLGIIGRSQQATSDAAGKYASLLERVGGGDVLGPAPYPVARVNDEWRYRIAVRATDASSYRRFIRETLAPLAAKDRDVRLAINADP